MTRRHALVLAPLFALLGAACVDLFHGTEFETLCVRSPEACAVDGGAPGADAGEPRPPRPDFCKWTTLEAEEQAKRACAWLGACEGPLGASTFGSCTIAAQLAFDCVANPTLRPAGNVDAFWACMATVRSCAEVDECVFPGGAQPCTGAAGPFTRCGTAGNEHVRLACSSPTEARPVGVEPCLIVGKTCVNEDEGSTANCAGGLGLGNCTATKCVGTKAVACNLSGAKSFDDGIDCAGYGARECDDRSGGGPRCVPGPEAKACPASEPPTATCDGGKVTSCVASKQIVVDCQRLGLGCDVTIPPPSYDPGQACVKGGATPCVEPDDSCSETMLRSCGRGARKSVDCASLGFSTCTVTNGRAACGPRR
ncbi:MAG: hypothetical protein KF819_15775 [Labilithrix sp.]|nr:hypothetical protein [Labilithrix sp.]